MNTLQILDEKGIQLIPALRTIIEVLEPSIEKRVLAYEKHLLDEECPPLPKFMEFYITNYRLSLIKDIARVADKYFLENDSLVILGSRDATSSFEVFADVTRDGVHYKFVTTQIIAGGHNIQCAHYRYLVKTKLAPTPSIEQERKIRNEMNRMGKVQRAQFDVDRFLERVQVCVNKLHAFLEADEDGKVLQQANELRWLGNSKRSMDDDSSKYKSLEEVDKYVLEISREHVKDGEFEKHIRLQLRNETKFLEQAVNKLEKVSS